MIEVDGGLDDVKTFVNAFEIIGVKVTPNTNTVSVQNETDGRKTTIFFVTIPNEPTKKVLEHLTGVRRVFLNPKIETPESKATSVTTEMPNVTRVKNKLDPNEPGLDADTKARREILAEMQKMSPEEIFQLAVRTGIYTPDGKLTPEYGGEEPTTKSVTSCSSLPRSPEYIQHSIDVANGVKPAHNFVSADPKDGYLHGMREICK